MNAQDLKTKYGTDGISILANWIDEVASDGGTLTQEQLEGVVNVLRDVGEAMKTI